MTITLIPFLVMLIGLVIYLATPPTRGRICEVGRVMFMCGLLVVLFHLVKATLRIP